MIKAGNTAIARQYEKASLPQMAMFLEDDPLGEERKYSPTKGIVHKFPGRVLWKVSYRCAAHCQFCTRSRQIGTSLGDLSEEDVENAISYIKERPEIVDVILSGGDPFYTPILTKRIVDLLATLTNVKIIRIGTRLPLQSPASFRTAPIKNLLNTLEQVSRFKRIVVLIHCNHPTELTTDVEQVLFQMRALNLMLFSQSVFLKNINDNTETLEQLFTKLICLGVVPYYMYRCDYVRGMEPYVVDIEEERTIMSELRRRLSGIAIPTYVVDVPGRGKIPIPLDFWPDVKTDACLDYDNQQIKLTTCADGK